MDSIQEGKTTPVLDYGVIMSFWGEMIKLYALELPQGLPIVAQFTALSVLSQILDITWSTNNKTQISECEK
jgi:hypothetical protein